MKLESQTPTFQELKKETREFIRVVGGEPENGHGLLPKEKKPKRKR